MHAENGCKLTFKHEVMNSFTDFKDVLQKKMHAGGEIGIKVFSASGASRVLACVRSARAARSQRACQRVARESALARASRCHAGLGAPLAHLGAPLAHL